MYESITLKFDGRSASDHQIAMNELGKSLLGIDRVINSGLIAMSYGRIPKRGERFNLVATAKEPLAGSFEVVTVLQNVPGLLPLVHDFLVSGGTEAVFRFTSYVLTKLGGRPNEAQMHLNAMLQMNRDHLDSRDRNEEQWKQTMLTVVDRLSPHVKDIATPIGKTASTLSVTASNGKLITTVDEPMADAIRSKEEDEVGDLEEMTIKVDGIINHSKQLKIENPQYEGKFLTAEVRDPEFESFPNVYSNAAANLGSLKVMAKSMHRNGDLHKIYIMDTIKSD